MQEWTDGRRTPWPNRFFQATLGWLLAALLASLVPAAATAQPLSSWDSVGPPGGTVLSLLPSPQSASLLYAGTLQNGVFLSADGGQTWTASNTGLPANSASARRSVRALVSDGQYIYAATDAGLHYTLAGASASDIPNWQPMAATSAWMPIALLAVDAASGTLFAAGAGADFSAPPVVYSMAIPALGAAPPTAWTESPLPAAAGAGTAASALTLVAGSGASPATLVVGAADRVYGASVTPGAAALSWLDEDPNAGLLNQGTVEAMSYAADFSQLYVCSGGQLFQATNPTDPTVNAWLLLSLPAAPGTALTCRAIGAGPNLLAVATNAGIFVSADGSNFSATSSLDLNPGANSVLVAGGSTPTLYVGSAFGLVSQSLAVTPTSSSAWTRNNGPSTISAGGGNGRLNNAGVSDSAVVGTTLYAAVASEQYSDVLASTDAGATWSSTGLGQVAGNVIDIPVLASDPTNRIVYAGTSLGVYALTAGAWVPVARSTITDVVSMARDASFLYVGTAAGVFSIPLRASPAGAAAAPVGLAALRVSALHVAGGKIYAGTYDDNTATASVSVATSVSAGTPLWSEFANGPVGASSVYSLALAGTSLLAATRSNLVSIADPGGAWTPASNGISDPNGFVRSLFSDGTTVFAATANNGLFASSFVGGVINWAPFNGDGIRTLPSLAVLQLRGSGTHLYASTAAGLAVFDGIVAVADPTPPAPVPATGGGGGGGGSLDLTALLGLALLLLMLARWGTPGRRPD